ncbi:MAG: peptide chain release factor N(5)-glutamine methyltransferase [Christensenellales bacterium]
MCKVKEILQNARQQLIENNILSGVDAEFLLAHILNVSRSQLIAIDSITDEQFNHFKELLTRRLKHEPMDSIIGFTDFLGVKIPFNKNVLTPRQETEIMVDNIIRDNIQNQNIEILDLCSGSGCIGLALSKHLDANVTLADISQKAIIISRQNATINNIKVNIISSNLFDNIAGKFDIIVSNPPYIPSNDLERLEIEVKDYDPSLALDGGIDGLDFYRAIIAKAPDYLKKDGLIYLEMGIGESLDIYKLLTDSFKDIEIFKDYSGIERYIKARKK